MASAGRASDEVLVPLLRMTIEVLLERKRENFLEQIRSLKFIIKRMNNNRVLRVLKEAEKFCNYMATFSTY